MMENPIVSSSAVPQIGDPLSSYLLIIGQEILSLLDHKLKQKNINSIKTSISGLSITHVMYADDIVLFSKAIKSLL